MANQKNVQMPMSFITGVLALTTRLESFQLDNDIEILCKQLEEQIEYKLGAMERHRTFTQYKTAPIGSDERENARKQYTVKALIPKDFVSEKELTIGGE